MQRDRRLKRILFHNLVQRPDFSINCRPNFLLISRWLILSTHKDSSKSRLNRFKLILFMKVLKLIIVRILTISFLGLRFIRQNIIEKRLHVIRNVLYMRKNFFVACLITQSWEFLVIDINYVYSLINLSSTFWWHLNR